MTDEKYIQHIENEIKILADALDKIRKIGPETIYGFIAYKALMKVTENNQ
ncbi:MAG: hypothetical protein ACUZ8H_05260 [Candidatus Anammoxibacter sp.]